MITAETYPGLAVSARSLGTGSPIGNISWSPDGTRLAVGYRDATVRLFDPGSELPLWEIRAGEGAIWHVVWSPSGKFLATYSVDGPVRLWEPSRQFPEAEVPVPDARVLALAWSRDESTLHIAAQRRDDTEPRIVMRAYDPRCGSILRELMNDVEWHSALTAVSGNRRLVALTLSQGYVEIWDLQIFDRIARIPGQEPVCSVVQHPTEPLLAIGFISGTVHIQQLPEGRLVRSLEAHDRVVHSLAFSSDGTILAAKSQDGTVSLWRCDTWSLIVTFPEPSLPDSEIEVAFHPSTLELATFDQRNTVVRIWKIDRELLFMMGGSPLIKILFMGANPQDPALAQIRIDKEIREIQGELQLSDLRGKLDLHIRTAVRPEDVSRALISLRPQVVHFSGHGEEEGEIWLEDTTGRRQAVEPDDLAALFKIVRGKVSCVVLNACYSEKQAQALARHVPYIVGMTREVTDEAAISFSIGFYQGLGAGLSFPDAFDTGCALVRMRTDSDWTIPVLVSGGR